MSLAEIVGNPSPKASNMPRKTVRYKCVSQQAVEAAGGRDLRITPARAGHKATGQNSSARIAGDGLAPSANRGQA
jgi:hypothetical protein